MTLHQLVIDSAAEHPSLPAVVTADGDLTYGALDRRANALAHRLRALGVARGDRVIIWAEKSAPVITAMQAVLRLGAAYVPVDGSAPLERVAGLAEDCSAAAVLTTADRVGPTAGRLPSTIPCRELTAGDDEEIRPAAVNEPVGPDNLAYILYTSGSTGAPKGVCISHRNALAFVEWAVETLDATPEDRFSNHAPFNFDLSVLDLYAAFSVGASVHLIPAELAYAPEHLVEFLHRQRITVWYSVPSALILMIRDGALLDRTAPGHLRAVLFAGEPFPIPQVRQLVTWTSARLFNLYGPTETNVCTFREVVPADLKRERPVPIGIACSGDRAWAQRPDGEVSGPGEEGELFVDGPTVMLGYWGAEPHRGPYPTGDIVKVLDDGSFDYVGRHDHMVKVRGHRIELGEVEAALSSHPAVAEAAALVVGSGMESRLVACVVPRNDHEPGVLELRRHCAQRLPRYMLADELRLAAQLPRTRNGKIDRAALTSQF
ncbi:D-alanine--poly(phosphoribitol) ligase [Streptomyces sp. IMTB 2501]|uniref:amino acid adenylation domain-containing protein n=1 Tax=Streptomyces sp. IMTB 2501 TaxID=1776340 RepID=UPI00096E7BB9|nr:amino acid adenylation domain-containing protein [Streptomyces sp. IMTB 2501]OLZ60597.1 D-alanine--poly(phosphoribitol) ligase [Streptomyces sp. IMTB 2501]